MVSQNVQANAAIRVDVGVVNSGGEVDLWRLKGVVGRELDIQEEHARGIWRVRLQQVWLAQMHYTTLAISIAIKT